MKRTLLSLVILAGLLLPACAAPQTYPAPAPLSLSGASYEASDTAPLAIAMDASGTSHIARLECRTDDPDDCRVIYQAIHMGKQTNYMVWLPTTGLKFQNPDIAVTDSGLAITVFQTCEIETNFCSTWMLRSDNNLQAWVVDVGKNVRGVPLVVSRGEVIYAVHEVINDNGSALRYCRVTDQPFECHWVSAYLDPDTLFRTDPTAAVSSLGTLHVSYLVKATNSMQAYYADNAGDTNEDMTNASNHTLNFGQVDAPVTYFPPAIAIETDNGYAYIALGRDETTSDALSIHYISLYTADVQGVASFILPADDLWNIYGRPSITANTSSAYIAFSALTTDTATEGDIYQVGYTIGDSGGIPTRPYPTSLDVNLLDCDPVIALVEGLPVIGWHICSPYAGRDAIYFYSILGGQIIHTPASFMNGRGELDMASNGDYLAGVWNEFQADGKLATWFAYNAHMLWLPVVKK